MIALAGAVLGSVFMVSFLTALWLLWLEQDYRSRGDLLWTGFVAGLSFTAAVSVLSLLVWGVVTAVQ